MKRIVKNGFTLIEMMVVVAITVIMTGVILMNLPDTRNAASADLIAQEVAIYIRSAQNYITKEGLPVRRQGRLSLSPTVYICRRIHWTIIIRNSICLATTLTHILLLGVQMEDAEGGRRYIVYLVDFILRI